MAQTTNHSWSLEIVRGKDAGRRYALAGSSVLLGNAVMPGQGINLADQEGTAPRKMAARQASIEVAGNAFVLRDLDSPGGTFVNQKRVLSGQSKPLELGDVIQLGGVQLKVVNGEASTRPSPPSAAVSTPAPFSITLKSGSICRSWDDILAISAQRWEDLRDELISGRLAARLSAIGRSVHAPKASEKGSPDERLDAWLARLPTTKPALPELDVHPRSLVLKAIAGGGVLFPKLRVENTGYRLLRFSARVDCVGTPWLVVAPEFANGTKTTVEGLEIRLEATIPEVVAKPMTATLVIESNGGTRSVPVTLEPATAKGSIVPESAPAAGVTIGLGEWLAGISAPKRWIGGALVAGTGRFVLSAATSFAATFGIGVAGGSPSLAGSGLAMAAIGAVLGGLFAIRKKAWADLLYAAFAGAFGGLIAATLAVAATRSVETAGGTIGQAPLAAKVLLWALIGLALAAVSTILVPAKSSSGRKP